MKIRKDVGLIIKFDDVEYSKEECASLYQQFFELLCEVAKYKYCPKNIGKVLADAVFERKKQISKEVRTLKHKQTTSYSDFAIFCKF